MCQFGSMTCHWYLNEGNTVPEALEAPHPLRCGEGAELCAGGEGGGQAGPDEAVGLQRRGGGDAAVEKPDDEVHRGAGEDGPVRLHTGAIQ